MARAIRLECRSSPKRQSHSARVRFFGFVHQIRGARAIGAHPHVQRAIMHKGKATFGLIQLHGRYAQIQHNAISGGWLVETGIQIAELAMHQPQVTCELLS